jgi:dTDP-4-dehydrorhamnose 3,5-epimerase-like enzyme
LDVILDIRVGSPTYGKATCIELSSDNFKAAYLPIGVAHGFCVLEDDTTMIYLTSTVHSSTADDGLLFNSFDFEWPISNGIHSERDLEFKPLAEFDSPFIYTP